VRTSSAIILLVLFVLGGCASVADPRQSAFVTLFEPTGELNSTAFKAALEARFIPGSQIKLLVDYAHSMNANWCSAPDAGGVMTCEAEIETCASAWSAKLTANAEVIQTIKFAVGPVVCD
jgi:hypothetical protein